MKILIVVLIALAAVIALAWLGLQLKPAPFAPHPENTPNLTLVEIPASLPAPVQRFLRAAYGEQIPLINSAVIKGRASIAPFGVRLPARFLFVHNAGRDYRHFIQATWFGLPFLSVNERYVDGASLFELPFGVVENDPATSYSANLAVWAEAAWFPSIWATDPRVRWLAVDDTTAVMYVPYEGGEQNFVLRFNPETGLLDTMEAMRYRDSGSQARKILWITRNDPGGVIPGTRLSNVGSAIWFDQGKPWAVFTLEQVNFNVDVSKYIRQKGP